MAPMSDHVATTISPKIFNGQLPVENTTHCTTDVTKHEARKDDPYLVACICISTIATVVLFSRLFSRAVLVRQFGWDDGLALISWLFFAGFSATIAWNFHEGVGRGLQKMQRLQHATHLETLEMYEKVDEAAHIVYTISLVLCRASALAFYYRVCHVDRCLAISIRILWALLIVLFVPQILLLVFHCRPFTVLWYFPWQPGSESHHCLIWGAVYSTNATSSVISDLLIFGVPVAMLRRLDMPRTRKVQLALIMLPGILIVGLSGTRLWLIAEGEFHPQPHRWYYGPMLIIEVAEIAFTLMAISVPGISTLFERIRSRARGFPGSQIGSATTNSHDSGQEKSTLQLRPPGELVCSRAAWAEGSDNFRIAGEPRREIQSYSNTMGGIMVQVDFNLETACERPSRGKKHSSWLTDSTFS